jgi:hypothetical protein
MEVSRGDGSVIQVEVAGERRAAPVLFCHGLADSRLSAHLFGQAARELGLRVLAPAVLWREPRSGCVTYWRARTGDRCELVLGGRRAP